MLIGTEAELADGTLLFEPDGRLIVTNVARTVTYDEERDYVVDRPRRRLVGTPTSRMPWVRHGEQATDALGVLRQLVVVSYEHHEARWSNVVTRDYNGALPRVTDRLQQTQPVSICVLGDSIAEGYDSSGFQGVPPEQPPFPALVAEALEARSGSSVVLRNLAVAGATAEDGRWLAAEAAALAPDLVLVAFGMNDACYAEAGEFSESVADIIRRVLAIHGDAEFLLVSPMRPTPACAWVSHERFPQYRDALHGLTRSGVALADVTSLWDRVLARKRPHDLSGNGSNHPNDFGHRLYAQVILATMGWGS